MDDALAYAYGDLASDHWQADPEVLQHGLEDSGVAYGSRPGVEEETLMVEGGQETPGGRRLLEDRDLAAGAQ